MKWFDNLNLGPKIIVALVVVAAVPLVIVGGYGAAVTEEALIEASVREMESHTRIEAARIEGRLEGIRSDVLFLSRVPPIQGVARARSGGGFDVEGGSSYAQWVDRLNVIFSQAGGAKPDYLQLRYLDETGNEMVRVDVTDGQAEIVRGESLQNKADTQYFRMTMVRGLDEIFVSPMNLNVEHGEIELPFKPVVRFSIPVFDDAGVRRGLVILNVSAAAILGDAAHYGSNGEQAGRVANSSGYYLSHPDEGMTWGQQLGHGRTMNEDFPELAGVLLRPEFGYLVDVNGDVVTHAPIFPDTSDRTRYWKIIETTPRAQILGAVRRFEIVVSILFAVALVAAIGLGVWLTRRWIIGPLVDLAGVAGRFAAGDASARTPVRHRDEIGQLTTAFNGMGLAIQLAQETLEQRVVQRTAELNDSEKRARTILDFAMDGIVTIDQEGIVQSYNRAAEHMFGYPAEQVVGNNVAMLMPEMYRDEHQRQLKRYLRTGESSVIDMVREMMARRKDGTTIPVDVAVTVARLGRGPLFVGILRDITIRKQADEALRDAKMQAEFASQAKSDFLANMSHELRTPLNAIIGFSEMIRGEMFGPIGSPKYLEYVNDINDSGEHLLRLINDILDLSKIEAGKLELHEGDVDVAAAVHACMTLVKERATSGGIGIECQVSPGLPMLRADELKLKQVLLNLLSNAVKFTPSGGRVTLSAADDASGGLRLSVADTGIGMSPEGMVTAMEPFGQVDNDLSRHHQGTGLGLPLAKALVELHGGSFELESEEGAGTTVTACFPLQERCWASA